MAAARADAARAEAARAEEARAEEARAEANSAATAVERTAEPTSRPAGLIHIKRHYVSDAPAVLTQKESENLIDRLFGIYAVATNEGMATMGVDGVFYINELHKEVVDHAIKMVLLDNAPLNKQFRVRQAAQLLNVRAEAIKPILDILPEREEGELLQMKRLLGEINVKFAEETREKYVKAAASVPPAPPSLTPYTAAAHRKEAIKAAIEETGPQNALDFIVEELKHATPTKQKRVEEAPSGAFTGILQANLITGKSKIKTTTIDGRPEDIHGAVDDILDHFKKQISSVNSASCRTAEPPVANLGGPVANLGGPVANLGGPVAPLDGPVANLGGPVANLGGPVVYLNNTGGPVAYLNNTGGPVANIGNAIRYLENLEKIRRDKEEKYWAAKEAEKAAHTPEAIEAATKATAAAEEEMINTLHQRSLTRGRRLGTGEEVDDPWLVKIAAEKAAAKKAAAAARATEHQIYVNQEAARPPAPGRYAEPMRVRTGMGGKRTRRANKRKLRTRRAANKRQNGTRRLRARLSRR